MQDEIVSVREDQPTFSDFPQYLGNDSSMFETSQKTWNPALLYWSVNVIILQQKFVQSPQ